VQKLYGTFLATTRPHYDWPGLNKAGLSDKAETLSKSRKSGLSINVRLNDSPAKAGSNRENGKRRCKALDSGLRLRILGLAQKLNLGANITASAIEPALAHGLSSSVGSSRFLMRNLHIDLPPGSEMFG
jgi:hypothetical protein